MAKVLNVVGIDKEFVIRGCLTCPFNNDCISCGLSHLFSMNGLLDFQNHYMSAEHGMWEDSPHPNCPLPDKI